MSGKERLRGWREDASGAAVFADGYGRLSSSPYVQRVAHAARVRVLHRGLVYGCVMLGLIAVVVGTLFAALPTVSDKPVSLLQPRLAQVKTKRNAIVLITIQGATATAITQDGYEYQGAGGRYSWPGVQRNFTLPDGTVSGVSVSPNLPASAAGVGVNTGTGGAPVASTGVGSETSGPAGGTTATGGAVTDTGTGTGLVAEAAAGLNGLSSLSGTIADTSFYNQFTSGQCTYWADYEYHRLRGHAVPWRGNAATWAANASLYGWNVSDSPQMHSIIVLQPGVQGAGWAGHVGVVEGINSDGSVLTTNWNVRGWGRFSREIYRPAPGVSFVWHS